MQLRLYSVYNTWWLSSFNKVIKKSVILLSCHYKGVASAMSKHAGFHLHAHTRLHIQEKGQRPRKRRHKEGKFNPFDAHSSLWSDWGLVLEIQADTSLQEAHDASGLRGAVPLVHHTHSITCTDLWAAVVLSLTKSDLPIPSCESKSWNGISYGRQSLRTISTAWKVASSTCHVFPLIYHLRATSYSLHMLPHLVYVFTYKRFSLFSISIAFLMFSSSL